jgi:NitT/TauT family transport system ATP-binding protein
VTAIEASAEPGRGAARRERPADRPALIVRSVGRRFPDGTHAVGDLSLAVAPGEIVAIVGASGCGKSTLLRLVAGLDTPTSGSIDVDADRLGYVFQDPTLLPWRTVRDNVELLGELHGLTATERRARAEHALAVTGLSGVGRQRPRQLSGGMRMRVSLARALTLRPTLFLLDEPFGALDELTRERLNEELLALHESEAFAAVFVTHSVIEATFLANRVLVMAGGPGRFTAEIPVPFAHPRPSELRFDAAFAAVAGRVSAALHEAAA